MISWFDKGFSRESVHDNLAVMLFWFANYLSSIETWQPCSSDWRHYFLRKNHFDIPAGLPLTLEHHHDETFSRYSAGLGPRVRCRDLDGWRNRFRHAHP
jgi:hypothetical protein